LEEKFNIILEIHEIEFYDRDLNCKIILIVNIVSNISFNNFFSETNHRSFIAEETISNLLQPYLSRELWNINALFLKLNNVFIDEIESDWTYPSFITRNEALTWLYNLNIE